MTPIRKSIEGSLSPEIRACIGMDLAAAPMAIFLDEPTSGLDATTARSIIRTLKPIAGLGISVVVIIHQPSLEVFDMIDDLILLANGQQLYEGPKSGVRPLFKKLNYRFPKANFGDIVTDIITEWSAVQRRRQHLQKRTRNALGDLQDRDRQHRPVL